MTLDDPLPRALLTRAARYSLVRRIATQLYANGYPSTLFFAPRDVMRDLPDCLFNEVGNALRDLERGNASIVPKKEAALA